MSQGPVHSDVVVTGPRQIANKTYAHCPECGRLTRLTKNGMLYRHSESWGRRPASPFPRDCFGTGQVAR